jgi:hypothetical protein
MHHRSSQEIEISAVSRVADLLFPTQPESLSSREKRSNVHRVENFHKQSN